MAVQLLYSRKTARMRTDHRRLVAHSLGIRRENPAGVAGDTERPYHLEMGLADRIGRKIQHA
jgi:hypothetical protein